MKPAGCSRYPSVPLIAKIPATVIFAFAEIVFFKQAIYTTGPPQVGALVDNFYVALIWPTALFASKLYVLERISIDVAIRRAVSIGDEHVFHFAITGSIVDAKGVGCSGRPPANHRRDPVHRGARTFCSFDDRNACFVFRFEPRERAMSIRRNIHRLRPPIRINVRITPSGAWLVQDERDHRGGRFRDRASAMRFIRREFGEDPRLHFRLWPAVQSKLSA